MNKIEALLKELTDRRTMDRARVQEVLDTVLSHHGQKLALAAKTVAQNYDASLGLITLFTYALPEPVMKIASEALADIVGRSEVTVFALACDLALDRNRMREVEEIRKLLEPLRNSAEASRLAGLLAGSKLDIKDLMGGEDDAA